MLVMNGSPIDILVVGTKHMFNGFSLASFCHVKLVLSCESASSSCVYHIISDCAEELSILMLSISPF
jgi:hypothetical protein